MAGEDVNLPSVSSTHRHLWVAAALILAFYSFFQGIGYALAGNEQVNSPSFYVIAHAPGHAHLHGWAMIVVAGCMFVQAFVVDQTKRFLQIFCGYYVLVSVSIFGSWWATGKITFGAPWSWLAFAALASIMILFPPPYLRLLRGRDDA